MLKDSSKSRLIKEGVTEQEVKKLIVDGIVYPFRNESDIKEFHDKIIDSFGGCRGIITEGNITQAVFESIHQGKTKSHKETIINKSASMMFNIIHGHPFTDGNKRTGLTIAETYILLNGYKIIGTEEDLYGLALDIASTYGKSSEDLRKFIKGWLRKHVKSVKYK